MDNPAARKLHLKSTPLLGGLSVFIGFGIVVLWTSFIYRDTMAVFNTYSYLLGALVILITGLVDDKFGMSPIVKLFFQALVCLIFIHTNNIYTLLGNVWITLPILLLWMTGLMNAYNFLDNMDGILSGMACILALGFYAISFTVKTPNILGLSESVSLLSLSFAGATLGFLRYNFNPAKIFLGDAGSMFFGYFLSTMGILAGKLTVNTMNSKMFYLLPTLLLSYAIFDISLVSITRKRDGRRISQGGKDHSTHRIDTAVNSHKLTALFVYLINTIIVLMTIIMLKIGSAILLCITTAIFIIVFLYFGRKLNKIPIVVTENQLKK
ncbi:MAG: undecaprenyl/decaprenyl-phosphate alpha-N-acetylglucosaminyl 1-phosphate transferase [Candidatus Cloacimonetes bacterium]|nr:undecaprenyl/decaprenyl-phosphate alpha-N-acetylglucosaminyl 1-phosphate transferase [Candidatus Cloacimonadota bacterium]